MADEHYELDIGRAQTLLGWRTEHALRRSLQTMIARLRADPSGWYQRNKLPLPLWLDDVRIARQPGRSGARLIADYNIMARTAHRQTLWCHFTNIALGCWLLASPFTFGLAQQWMEAGASWAPNGRGLAYSATWMTASDMLAGALVVLFGLLSLSRDFGWARWSTAAVGLWLLFAPVLFWTTSAAAYAKDTLVGALLIVFAVALPPAPGITPVAQVSGPDAPPGWDYSPSGWTNRIPIIALAIVGLVISRYLAAFQLGHIDAVWDPFFGEGTERIITSSVSEAWPVSDAGLGATVYVLEIITGVIGDKRRWRTMPWLVLLFGVLIVPLGAVSVFFIIIQPVVIGTWCTLCLVGALAMLLQIPTGVSVPWNLLVSTLIGVTLMCSRLLFDSTGQAADNDHIIGSLVVTFSIMAWAEVARPLRFVNFGFGAWLLAAPWLLDGYAGSAALASVVLGAALIVLAYPRGKVVNHFGAWDRIARASIGFSARPARSAQA